MNCPWCGYDNPERARICGDCGRTLKFDVACPQCGASNPRMHVHCDACGAALSESASAGGQATAPQPVAASHAPSPWPWLSSRLRSVRLPEPGLRWRTPAPRVEWSRSYLRAWVARNRLELLAVAACMAVAAFLRIYRLADIPAGLTGDEALTGIDALRVLKEGWIGPYVGSALGQPTGPLYFTALVFKVSDASIFTLRLSMAILGVATVPAAYLLLRLGFGRWIALFAVVALVFSYWHLHFSRIAFMLISMPLFTTLTAIAVLSALRSARKWPWALAGLLLGAGVYTYNGYVMFVAALGLFVAIVLLVDRREWRRYPARLAMMAAVAVLVALPMIRLAYTSPEFYFQHHRLVSVLKDPNFQDAESAAEKAGFLAGRLWDAGTLLYSHPGIDFSDGLGGRGALDPILALLAYAGLAISLARWRSPPHLMLALIVIAGLGVVVLGGENWGELRRSLLAVPFVYGLAGVAALEIVSAGRRLRGVQGLRLAGAGVAVLLVAAVTWNTWTYFGHLVRQGYVDWVFASDLVAALQAAHSFEEPGQIYFYAPRWGYKYETRRFLYPDTPGVDRSREFGHFSLDRLDTGPVTYLLLPPYDKEVEALRERYPGGTAIVRADEDGGGLFSVYHLP